jgi:hypothetical protein
MRSRHVHRDVRRARCLQHLRGIEIPRPFSLEAFAAAVAADRGRPLHVLPLPGLDGTDGLSGAWAATDLADYVLIDAASSGWHRDLIGLHEIGHVLGAGQAGETSPGGLARSLRPGLSTGAFRQVPGRGACSSAGEQEAELTAWLVLAGLPESTHAHAGRPSACLASLEALHGMRNELVAAVPGAAAGSWSDAMAGPAGDPRIRLIRSTAEIRDAALALRGYVPPGTVAEARRLLAAQVPTGEAFNAATEACWLDLAVRAVQAGAPARNLAHVLPGRSTLHEEARWLGGVAAAMHSPPVLIAAAQLALAGRQPHDAHPANGSLATANNRRVQSPSTRPTRMAPPISFWPREPPWAVQPASAPSRSPFR